MTLGAELSKLTDHYLLMAATPHKGDPEKFCMFLELLDRDVYGDVKSLEEAMRKKEAPYNLRRVKIEGRRTALPHRGVANKPFRPVLQP